MRLVPGIGRPISNLCWFGWTLFVTVAVLLLSGLVPAPVQAQFGSRSPATTARHSEEATKIVLLGVSHFAGSATDEYSSSAEEILSAQRQRELDTVATRLAAFEPDQFMVERTPDRQHKLDSLYEAYRSGAYEPTADGHRNEIYQLGFRAADGAGLSRVHAVDAEGIWLGDKARSVAQEHDPELLKEYRAYGNRVSKRSPQIRSKNTIADWLTVLNSDSLLYNNHKAYIYYYARMGSFDDAGLQTHWKGDLNGQTFVFTGDFGGYPVQRIERIIRAIGGNVQESIDPNADYLVRGQNGDGTEETANDLEVEVRTIDEVQKMILTKAQVYIGFPDHHVGADLVGEWYKRNLRIYANIWQTVKADTDRVIAMFGQGHIWTLRQFFRENPDFEVVPVSEVL